MNLLLTCPPEPCYSNIACDIEKEGRVVAVVFVKKSSASLVNKSSKAAWLNSFWSLALAGDAILILNISGEKPRPETATLPGRGRQPNKMGAKTHTLNLFDMQIVGNVQFYNDMLKSSINYDLYYITPDLIWDASGQVVTVNGDVVIQNDLTQYISGEVTVMWQQNGTPLPYDFEDTVINEGLNYIVSGATSVTIACAGGETESYTAALNQPVSTTLPNIVWSLSGDQDALDATGAVIDATTGIVTFNAVDFGTYQIQVVATSSTGCVIGTLVVNVNSTCD